MLIAGFDAGQTHTRCRLQRWLSNPEPGADAGAGSIVGEGEGSGVCHLAAEGGEAAFQAAIRSSLNAALTEAALPQTTPIKAAVVGASGIEQGTALQQRGHALLCQALQLDPALALVNGDERTALHAAFPQEAGIVLISGTGMICLGRNAEGREHRSGGWGWRLDGAGSAYDIGHQGLQLSLRMADGRLPKTRLLDQLWTALGCSSPEAIKTLAAGQEMGVAAIARLAPLVEAEAQAGDKQALQVLDHSAMALAEAVAAVATALDLPSASISAQGGAITHLRLLRNLVEQHLTAKLPHWQWASSAGDACDGALSLALGLLRPH